MAAAFLIGVSAMWISDIVFEYLVRKINRRSKTTPFVSLEHPPARPRGRKYFLTGGRHTDGSGLRPPTAYGSHIE
ncbi:hypothetical protein FJ462_33395, partial [Mesorhizobium sp. B2-6-7]